MNPATLRTIRAVVLFVGGIAGIGYETLIEQGEKPTLLILFAAMIGLPYALGKDEKRRDEDKGPKTEPP